MGCSVQHSPTPHAGAVHTARSHVENAVRGADHAIRDNYVKIILNERWRDAKIHMRHVMQCNAM